MAEDQSHDDDELSIAATEDGSPDVSTTEKDEDADSQDGKNSESPDGEESKDSLDLEKEEDTASPAEKKRLEQENVWFGKIVSGQKTLDDLPKHQQWLREPLEKRLTAHKKTEQVAKDYDVPEIVRQQLADERDEQAFKAMESSLTDMSLTATQVADLKSEFKDFRQAGLSKAKALQKAIKVAGINLETDMRRQYMASPKAGDRKFESNDSDPRKKYPKGDPRRVKALDAEASQYGRS